MSVDDIIQDFTGDSDITFGCYLYQEVLQILSEIEFNIAFYVYKTSNHSACARTVDGSTISCPVLTLYLRYNADFRRTGIDSHKGNWDDQWAQTRTIRDAFNSVLKRNGYVDSCNSNYTFIFVRTLEELVFQQIGQQCTEKIKKLICAEAPGVKVDGVYWDGNGYYALMRDKVDYKNVKRNIHAIVSKEIPKLLADADQDGSCQDYSAQIQFGYGGIIPRQFLY